MQDMLVTDAALEYVDRRQIVRKERVLLLKRHFTRLQLKLKKCLKLADFIEIRNFPQLVENRFEMCFLFLNSLFRINCSQSFPIVQFSLTFQPGSQTRTNLVFGLGTVIQSAYRMSDPLTKHSRIFLTSWNIVLLLRA